MYFGQSIAYRQHEIIKTTTSIISTFDRNKHMLKLISLSLIEYAHYPPVISCLYPWRYIELSLQ